MAEQAMTVRAAGPRDVPAIVALVESAYRGDSSRAGWTTEADILQGQRTDAEAVAAQVADPDSVVLLAERGGELQACCHLERHDGHAYFGMFAVRPLLQGGGLGKAVIAEAERYAADEWGVPEMHMTVISVRAELIAWYERRGYARTGQTSPFPYGDERFGLPQRDDLEFELLVKKLA
ncbi:GNAT family N-acetyltransferase [Catellatospora chokoriensis]|uniref:N-acetyltransferase n=1 Tax=Catellatospora chokoriensis TaxID=310353 RepID=A0A8J3JQT0_9ACTN|nr:GNAT family N-acetyltransferase [Catellatospora chokoriensis]GIF89406.1 N-acetyltransferase [Catellatospora chokoriensis]